jgi:hypothetical protein
METRAVAVMGDKENLTLADCKLFLGSIKEQISVTRSRCSCCGLRRFDNLNQKTARDLLNQILSRLDKVAAIAKGDPTIFGGES